MARVAIGDLGTGIDDFTEAIGLEPNDDTAWSCRSAALQEKGDFAAAKSDIDEAIARKPEVAFYRSQRAHLAVAQARWDSAIADASGALCLGPNDVNAYKARSWAWREKQAWASC